MFQKLFSRKPNESAEEIEGRKDIEHLERAQQVSKRLVELRDADPQWFASAAGMIFLLQQDFYRHYGIDFAGVEATVKKFDIENNLEPAMQALGNLCVGHNSRWVGSAEKKEAEKTFLYGISFNACDFWFTDMAAQGSTFSALKLCAEKNHLLICTAERSSVIQYAERFRGFFLNLPAYEFRHSHWPYRDADAVIEAWSKAKQKLFE
ncbi:hypothetical protein PV773_22975 [Mesorhizobium sp. CC13]|uniref:hypothetical protein n=1 Tax=Mesorhizobium sp. CC13 TaxID=3029194 RepID=UPI003267340F